MNESLGAVIAIAVLYLIVRFTFGGNNAAQAGASSASDPHRGAARVGVRAGRGASLSHQSAASSSSASGFPPAGQAGSSSSAIPLKPVSLISRFNLESRVVSSEEEESSDSGLLPAPASRDAGSKGKGRAVGVGEGAGLGGSKVQGGGNWKANADERATSLRQRKEQMILEARRKLEAKQRAQAKAATATVDAPFSQPLSPSTTAEEASSAGTAPS
ncbi:hypothetical protein V8E36_006689 [Tilletia maclaganii]